MSETGDELLCKLERLELILKRQMSQDERLAYFMGRIDEMYDGIQRALAIQPAPTETPLTRERCAEIVLSTMQHYEGEPCTATIRVLLKCLAKKFMEQPAAPSPAVQEAADALADAVGRAPATWAYGERYIHEGGLNAARDAYRTARAQAGKESA